MQPSPRPPSLLVAAALVAVSGCRDPDVVVFSIDTLRVDHVSAFDPASPVQTPAIDALAADGVAYTQAFTPISVTGPAFCTVFTGQDPGTHGVAMNLFRGGPPLGQQADTLAERLSAAGYHTGAFVSGFTLRKQLGLDQGFDAYDQPDRRNRRGDETADAAITWLGQQQGPLLLWYHSFDAHGPLRHIDGMAAAGPSWAHGEVQGAHLPRYQVIGDVSDPAFYRQRYATAVGFADAQVGRVVSALKAAGRYDRALVVFLADHGESFTEREMWFDHGTTPYAEQTHVPLIVKYPGGRHAGSRVDALVGLADVAPTVLDVLDLAPLPAADGVPLSRAHHALLRAESSHCKRNPIFSCSPAGPGGKLLAARSDAFTVVRNPTRDGLRYEVFDRKADPRELNPLVGQEAPPPLKATVDTLAAEREAMHLPEPPMVEAHEASDPENEALEELGYLE